MGSVRRPLALDGEIDQEAVGDVSEDVRSHALLKAVARTIGAAYTGDACMTGQPQISSVPIAPSEVEGTLEAPVIDFEATSTHGF